MIWKLIGIVLIAVFLATVCYETWRVLEARAATAGLITGIEKRSALSPIQLSASQTDVLIKVEDPTFWENDGLDFKTPGQGLTTLTQSLAKQLYFDGFTPGLQKLELMLISKFALAGLASKEDILSAFLATAYLGQDESGPIIGFSNAALRWHDKTLNSLSDDEFISLVAMLIAPNTLSPKKNPIENQERVERIKRLISGRCVPSGLLDVTLVNCAGPTAP